MKLDIVIEHVAGPQNTVKLTVVHQDKSLTSSYKIAGADPLYEDKETGWRLKSVASPEVSPSDKMFYIKGYKTDRPNWCIARFANATELSIFLTFVKKALKHLNKKPKGERTMSSGKAKESRFITINLDALTNPSKRRVVENMLRNGDGMLAIQYLRSIEGVPPTDRIETGRLKTKGVDKLAKEAGYYVKLYNKRYNPFEDHKPSSHASEYGKYMGIEIECLIPVTDKYYNVSGFGKWLSKEHKIKTLNVTDDGSLRPPTGFFGIEFRLLTKSDEMSNLKQLCDILRTLGAKVNRSCGLHVHLDMRTEDAKKGVDNVNLKGRRIGNALDILKHMVPSSRRSNSFCKLEVGSVDSSDRYYAVNRSSYSRHKTLEVRLHSGTVNYKKIANWCKLMFALSNSVKMTKNKPNNAEELFDLLELDESMRAYVLSRIEEFKKEADDEVDERPPMTRFISSVRPGDAYLNVDANVHSDQIIAWLEESIRANMAPERSDSEGSYSFRVHRIVQYISNSLTASGDRLYSVSQRDVADRIGHVIGLDRDFLRVNGRYPSTHEELGNSMNRSTRGTTSVPPSYSMGSLMDGVRYVESLDRERALYQQQSLGYLQHQQAMEQQVASVSEAGSLSGQLRGATQWLPPTMQSSPISATSDGRSFTVADYNEAVEEQNNEVEEEN